MTERMGYSVTWFPGSQVSSPGGGAAARSHSHLYFSNQAQQRCSPHYDEWLMDINSSFIFLVLLWITFFFFFLTKQTQTNSNKFPAVTIHVFALSYQIMTWFDVIYIYIYCPFPSWSLISRENRLIDWLLMALTISCRCCMTSGKFLRAEWSVVFSARDLCWHLSWNCFYLLRWRHHLASMRAAGRIYFSIKFVNFNFNSTG